jgi:tRNA-dihydrouridine synthase B
VARNNRSALDLIDIMDPSTPTGLQLLVKSADELVRALTRIEALSKDERPHFKNIKVVDLNFGCPSKDVVNEGAGPAMLKRKNKLSEIFLALSSWKRTTSLPNVGAVGVKIRLGLNGYEEKCKVYLAAVDLANEAGLDYITVHGRNASQRSSEPAHWAAIQEVKTIAKMPVIGNGDVACLSDLLKMKEQTGCDGVMVARAAIQNPWVFQSLTSSVHHHHNSLPSLQDLDTAASLYADWGRMSNAKVKFTDFHIANFARLRQSLSSKSLAPGNTPRTHAFNFPKNNHFA